METVCSFSGIAKIECGESRHQTEVLNLVDCCSDISTHLASCHLSKSDLKEYELILARSGRFGFSDEQIRMMQICPSHRHNLGRYWRPLRSCRYPLHQGPVRACKGRHVFSVQLSVEVLSLHGVLIQVGSRK